VAAHALGMNKIVSEDALRRTLERIDEASSTAWMRPALMHSVRQALDVQVTSGKQHTSVPAKAALARLLKELGDGPDSRRPTLVRCDSGYGNEGILLELERRNCKCHCREGIGNLCHVNIKSAFRLSCSPSPGIPPVASPTYAAVQDDRSPRSR
jgi:hypothetical protein